MTILRGKIKKIKKSWTKTNILSYYIKTDICTILRISIAIKTFSKLSSICQQKKKKISLEISWPYSEITSTSLLIALENWMQK